MSVAWSAIPSRSTPKKAIFFGRSPASTRPTRCGEAWESSPRGVDTSRPWITSCDSAPSGPPPGGDQGCSMLSRRDASSCAVDNCCASMRARRSAIRSNIPLALTISTTTWGSEYRKGIVVCARTSRTRHPSHRVAASHWGSASEEYRATCSRRSATTAALISGSDMCFLLRRPHGRTHGSTGSKTSATPRTHRRSAAGRHAGRSALRRHQPGSGDLRVQALDLLLERAGLFAGPRGPGRHEDPQQQVDDDSGATGEGESDEADPPPPRVDPRELGAPH